MDDYQSHDAVGLAELVRDKTVSAQELLEAARARADEVNPRINAVVVDVDPPRGRRDRSVRRRAVPAQGPRAGVRGRASSYGCRALAHVPATEHATVVQRWLDAGLVVFGKTNTPEFGAKGITEPALFGAARNPWDLDRTPGRLVGRVGRRGRGRHRPGARAPATAAARSASRRRAAACSASRPAVG